MKPTFYLGLPSFSRAKCLHSKILISPRRDRTACFCRKPVKASYPIFPCIGFLNWRIHSLITSTSKYFPRFNGYTTRCVKWRRKAPWNCRLYLTQNQQITIKMTCLVRFQKESDKRSKEFQTMV